MGWASFWAVFLTNPVTLTAMPIETERIPNFPSETSVSFRRHVKEKIEKRVE
jgi:hypothetical protein